MFISDNENSWIKVTEIGKYILFSRQGTDGKLKIKTS